MIRCPSPQRLATLVAADDASAPLEVAELETLELHVGECALCQQLLESLAVDAQEWEGWAKRLRQDRIAWPDLTLPAAGPADGHAPRDLENPATWPTVKGYDILGVLGKGGMGVVYQARQAALGRLVALKTVPLAGPESAELAARLRREADAMARLHHPHVVQIHEVMEQEGRLFLALELMPGGNLADKLRENTLCPKDAAQLVETIARAMQAAHEAGVLHRDLKPANVLLTSDNSPKLSDFGLARRIDAAGDTRFGAVMGTPSYIPPEQAQARPGWSTPAVDVYALGAVLYESISGRPPFRGESSLETLRQVVEDEPLSPSRLQPGIPRDLETVCLKCLRKAPQSRYASCRALADDLRRFQEGRPIEARRTPWWTRLAMRARRHPFTAGLCVTICVAAAVLLGTWIKHTRDLSALNAELAEETSRANANLRQAQREKQQADFERRRAIAASAQLAGPVFHVSRETQWSDPAPPIEPGAPAWHGALDAFLTLNESLGAAQQARNYRWLGERMLALDQPQQAIEYLGRAVDAWDRAKIDGKEYPFDLATASIELARACLAGERFEEGAKHLERGRALLESHRESAVEAPPRVIFWQARALHLTAQLAYRQGNKDESRRHLLSAREVLAAAGEDSPEEFSALAESIRRNLSLLKLDGIGDGAED